MLTINQNLQRLNLRVGPHYSFQTYWGELELEDICEGLINNQSLAILDIGSNNIGIGGVRHIVNMLMVNGTLTRLHLCNKYII